MTILDTKIVNKLLFVSGSIIAIVLAIVIRLFHLQIYLSEDLLIKSQNNFLRYENITPLRGNIVDCNGKLLATNRPVINIYWKGSGNKRLSEQQSNTFNELTSILPDVTLDTSELNAAERKAQKIVIAHDVKFEQLSKVAEHFATDKNIIIETAFSRLYPYKKTASHILGYLGNLDVGWSGKMGLEKLYESNLKGKRGIKEKILNSFGKKLSEKKIEQSLAGNDITITLDLSLQRIAEMLFPKDKRGVFILMDSRDGSLRVALSRPNFDPNLFTKKMDHETWKSLQEQKPFLNRIYNASYPPGSIFKLVTLAAALESNVIDEDTIWDCKGSVTVGNRKFRCHRRAGHGPLTTTESIAKSCNVLFYEIAKSLDIDILAQFARKFGLGEATGSPFNDSSGLIPTRQWKEETKGERWWLGETLAANIGQSYLLTTPIQIARMIAAIEVGYLVAPRILDSTPINYQPLSVKYETRKFLQETMLAVVEEGTARRLGELDGFEIYAKTSTAQTSMLNKRGMGEQFLEHGWFTANFRYKDGSPMTLVILMENAGNARLSVMVAKAFLKSYRDLTELRKKRAKKNEHI